MSADPLDTFKLLSGGGPGQSEPPTLSQGSVPDLRDTPFREVELLGRGGMGAVFRATDARLGRQVALKLLLEPSHAARIRFRREGELAAALKHPNVVQVHEVYDLAGADLLVCELVPGARQLDEAWRGLELTPRIRLLSQAAAGVAAAHARGIVHRDLKPENVLVDAEGRVRVADFGIAFDPELDRLTKSGIAVGTPVFMAPEQICGEKSPPAPAMDVWALGVLLYMALCDELPFRGDTLLALALAISAGYGPAQEELLGEAPPALHRLLRQSLRVEPGQRPPDAASFGAALEAWLEDPLAEENPSRASWVGVTLLLLASVGVLALVLGSRPQPPVASSSQPTLGATATPSPSEAEQEGEQGQRQLLKAIGYHRAGRLEEAVEAYTRALAIQESSAGYHNRANAKQSLQDMSGALADLDRSIELEPGPGNLAERALLLRDLGQLEPSLADFERALALKEDPYNRFDHGETLRRLGRDAEALADAKRLQRILTRPPLGLILEARLLEGQAEHAQALTRIQAAAQVAPDDPRVLATLTRLYVALGRWREAKDMADRALRSSEGPNVLLRERGIARLRLGDAGGREDLERFLLLFPASPLAERTRRDLETLGGLGD